MLAHIWLCDDHNTKNWTHYVSAVVITKKNHKSANFWFFGHHKNTTLDHSWFYIYNQTIFRLWLFCVIASQTFYIGQLVFSSFLGWWFSSHWYPSGAVSKLLLAEMMWTGAKCRLEGCFPRSYWLNSHCMTSWALCYTVLTMTHRI